MPTDLHAPGVAAATLDPVAAPAAEPYPELWRPGRIGRLELKNRLVMAAMFVGYADRDGSFSRRHVDYFEARAKGGAAMLVTESVLADVSVQPVHPEAPVTRCDSDAVLPRMKELTDAVHRHGARIALQVSPGQGRQSHFATRQAPPKAPSPVPAFADASIPCRELTREEIRRLVGACADGALRGAMAGFDMVEVHAHTGYLVDQFMTPLWNRRGDEYGGSLENRLRFPLEIVAAIKARAGAAFPVGFRLTAEHRVAGGRTLAEALEIARRLEEAGVDSLTVDAGCYDVEHWMNPPVYLGEAPLAELAGAVRAAVGIPVIASGSITRPDLAQRVLAAGSADFVALGRGLLADPEWPAKARAGRAAEIRPCILCNEYCLGRLPSECMVNPAMGRERQLLPVPAPAARRVVVVGGGPGGMEAARVAAGRGHRVTLFERDGELGGQLRPAGDAGYKRSLRALRDQMAGQLAAGGVEVVLGRAVTAEDVLAAAPDAVVLATGAVPAAPPVPGIDQPHAVQVVDFHGGQGVGERVVVAGGGLNGCDAAVDLAERGHRVTLIDRNPEVGRDLNAISRGALLARLAELGVEVLPGTELVAVVPGGAAVRTAAGEHRELPADTVALALGARSENALVRQLKGKVKELYALGDCLKPRKIGEAIHEGHRVGLRIG